MENILSVIGSPIPFIIVIGVVVTVHELGHFYAGRVFGAAVESFAFGFGNSIIERTDRMGTRWRVNWLPLGGFVKFVGEAQAPGDLHNVEEGPVGKPYGELAAWQRVIVSLAGPIANFILAILIYAVFAMTMGVAEYERVGISRVIQESSAEAAGIKPDDQLVSIDGNVMKRPKDVQLYVQYRADEPLLFALNRGGSDIEVTVVRKRKIFRNEQLNVEEEVGEVGIYFEPPTGVVRLNPISAMGHGVEQTFSLVRTTVKVLTRLITGKDGFDKMRGPLGIGDFADKLVDSQMKQTEVPLQVRLRNVTLSLVSLVALFSVSIGFFNLLPIPMLDGYHALLGIYETVVGSEVSVKFQEYLLRGGLAAIGFFFIAVTWNDIKRTGVLEVFARMLS